MKILPRRVGRALELGVGDGTLTGDLAARVGHLTAADISRPALSSSERRSAELPNVDFEQMDAFEGELGGPYDLIVCGGVLQYADSRKSLDVCIGAMLKALVPGGRLVLSVGAGERWAELDGALRETELLDLKRAAEAPPATVALYSRRRSPRRRTFRRRPEPSENVPEFTGAHLESGVRSPATLIPILMYHRVAPSGTPGTRPWRLHPDEFEQQLRLMRDRGYQTLTFDQWRIASDRHQPIPARSVMLTFDDGYADFTAYALPLLEKYGFDATMFIVTDLVGKTNRWDERFGETLELMDWPTIRQIQSRGIEIGSHSSNHSPLIELSPAELTRDLCRSRMSFHENLSMEVRSVCYPWGLYDTGVSTIAGACGFRYGVTTDDWKASFNDDFLRLPRIEVRGDKSLADFETSLTE
jgi:peptidoglycan/xylan/chitin deacetylase (PgdA/CDA1 family)